MRRRPLAGQSILLTRPRAQSARLAKLLRSQGARVRIAPLIKTAAPRSWRPADRALRRLEAFDILIFTSANGVGSFLSRAREVLRPAGLARALGRRSLRVYAIGPATARALAQRGIRGARIPNEHEGAALARSIRQVRGRRVLLPRAEVARADLPRILRALGASVTVAHCYRTVADPAGRRAVQALRRGGGVDWITFTSASTVDRFFQAAGPAGARALLARARAASIGPVTTAALKRRGAAPAVEAAPYTAEGLAAAIAARSRSVPLPPLRSTLRRALREAGALARRHYGRVKTRYKGRANLVTQADLECEQLILDIILKRFPDHDFLAEERPPRKNGADYLWVIDPIDGTTNYAHGYPAGCVSIALARRGETLLGGVYDFYRDELFFAEKGRGATLNGRPISVTRTPSLRTALLLTGFPYDRDKRARFYLDICRTFLRQGHGLRRSGTAALDLAWTAAGRVDGYWEFRLNPWDVAAGALLVREAGGKITDFTDRPLRDAAGDGPTTLATNGRIHGQMLRILRGKK
ncbi:MAG: inositol monophosphatase family protein [Elusimicrobiota bacterium]